MTRPICLVTGATGAVGPAVVRALAAGREIRTLSRRPPAAGLFDTTVTSFIGDVSDKNAVRQAARGTDVIVHLAALLHVTNPPPERRAEYERVNVGGTAAVLDAAKTEGVGRVVFVSTIAVYGRSAGGMLDETSPARPDSFYGETKLAAEGLALDARRGDGSPLATVLRPAAVYGTRVKGNYERLVRAIACRRFVPVGPGANRRTLVFEEDLASAIALAATHADAAGRIYNVTDGGTHRMREIIAEIRAALGRGVLRWHVPVAPVRAALAIGGIVKPGLPHALDTYLEDVAVKGERIGDELGFRPLVGLAEGWSRAIAGMRQDGLL